MKRLVILFLIFILLISSVSAIRLSPAKIEGNFEPGLEREIAFYVKSDLNRDLEIYAKGDLEEYITFDKNILFKEGSFTAIIKLPEALDPPGRKVSYIGVRELTDKELKQAMATAVAVQALFVIHVPYPGKYAESQLKVNNVNVGEGLSIDLNIWSRGKEDITVNPRIEILSEDGLLLDTLYFNERSMRKDEKVELKKEWNTTGYNAGRYIAKSIVEYGGSKPSVDKDNFRVGELVINILNNTEEIIIGEIKSFGVEIESGWNDIIDGAYANVLIFNKTTSIANFKTTPTELTPWEKKKVYGHFNTSSISAGNYSVQMRVYYFGHDIGTSSSKYGTVRFVELPTKEFNYGILSMFLGIALFIMTMLVVYLRFYRKKWKRK